MKKRIILAVVSMVALSIIAFLLTTVMGRRPLKNLEIVAASVHLIPPDESVEIKDLEQLEELEYFEEIHTTRAGSVISSHCGPGTLGVLFIAGEEE